MKLHHRKQRHINLLPYLPSQAAHNRYDPRSLNPCHIIQLSSPRVSQQQPSKHNYPQNYSNFPFVQKETMYSNLLKHFSLNELKQHAHLQSSSGGQRCNVTYIKCFLSPQIIWIGTHLLCFFKLNDTTDLSLFVIVFFALAKHYYNKNFLSSTPITRVASAVRRCFNYTFFFASLFVSSPPSVIQSYIVIDHLHAVP